MEEEVEEEKVVGEEGKVLHGAVAEVVSTHQEALRDHRAAEAGVEERDRAVPSKVLEASWVHREEALGHREEASGHQEEASGHREDP